MEIFSDWKIVLALTIAFCLFIEGVVIVHNQGKKNDKGMPK